MSLPGGGVPIPAVPVPSSNKGSSSRRRRSSVMQSSLELVFSYSRHQQLRYGGSAPSFIDSSSSKSLSSPDRTGPNQYYDEERDVNGRRGQEWPESSGAEGDTEGTESTSKVSGITRDNSDPEIIFEEDEDDEEQQHRHLQSEHQERRISEDPSFFPSDPVPLSQPSQINNNSSSATPVKSDIAGTSATSGRGLFTLNVFSPKMSSSVKLGTSASTRSSGSQTPLANSSARRFLDTTSVGDSDIHIDDDIMEEEDERTSLIKDTTVNGYGTTVTGVHSSTANKIKKTRYPIGQSTDGQTLFNATAVLVGIGLLSMPLAFSYAGWIGGLIMLFGFGWLTCYTAKLLAQLIRMDSSLMGYTDIGVRAMGNWAGGGIHILFCLELFALGVALVVLFGDTLNAIYPDVSSNLWKAIGFAIILPTALLPLRLLSLPSLLSSVSSILLVFVLLIDGFVRTSAPGSIRHPMPTSLWPEWKDANWLGGIGLVLAGVGGHAVMPSIARDMKNPENFGGIVNKAFVIATAISFASGAAGYLMIGENVSDEITRDLMQEKYGYPRWLNLVALWMIVINPLSKFGLSSRPLNITIEDILGISPELPIFPVEDEIFEPDQDGNIDNAIDSGFKSIRHDRRLSTISTRIRRESRGIGESDWSYRSIPRRESVDIPVEVVTSTPTRERRKAIFRVISRTIVTGFCVITAILLPGFGKVMAFLGSFSAFLICIILPLLFHMRLSSNLEPESESTTSAKWQRFFHWVLIGICTVLMVAGTVWAFLPGSGHGGLEP
ncbi:uncharacterized protein L201_007521 [Kwoniella dendrophila CBS 6074]|uniref:Amino acid transporter transmembrane domain-containing protein n=1 Tax=Kwoniella dendrophila CBS 6074 TaxID=1295534 RepID=A0AAX4K6S1_9TREE